MPALVQSDGKPKRRDSFDPFESYLPARRSSQIVRALEFMSPRSSPGESPREEYGSPERLRVPLPAPPAPTVTADTETEYGEKIESSDKIGRIEKNEKVEKYEKTSWSIRSRAP